MKHLLAALICLTTLAVPAWANQGIVTLTVEPGGASKAQQTRVWLPYPVSTPQQDISEVRIQGNSSYSAVLSDPESGNLHLFAEWQGKVTDRRLVLQFQARGTERHVGELRDTGQPVPVEVQPYLQSSALIPTDGEVGILAQKIVADKEGILEKARAVYEWVVENTSRDPNVKGCGLGNVEATLSKLSGKCADLSSVYVALARSAGVPAREVFGLRLSKQEEEDITGGYHCWAEFYLPGTGWVPVDPADVRKIMLVQKLNLEQVEKQREYYFGSVDDNRIVLRRGGRGLTFQPAQKAGPLNYFMYPYAEVDGHALDYFDPKGFRYTVHFKAVK